MPLFGHVALLSWVFNATCLLYSFPIGLVKDQQPFKYHIIYIWFDCAKFFDLNDSEDCLCGDYGAMGYQYKY